MAKRRLKAVLDTNILISSLIYGGKPEEVTRLVIEKKVVGVISPALLAELFEILAKKFHFEESKLRYLEKKLKRSFIVVHPTTTLKVVKDDPDNRLLEAALEGNCTYIVTGDKELLALKSYKKIRIVTATEFLNSNSSILDLP